MRPDLDSTVPVEILKLKVGRTAPYLPGLPRIYPIHRLSSSTIEDTMESGLGFTVIPFANDFGAEIRGIDFSKPVPADVVEAVCNQALVQYSYIEAQSRIFSSSKSKTNMQ